MSKIQDMLSKLVAEGTLTAEQAVELAAAQTARRDNVRVQSTGNITVAGVPGLARFGLTSNIVGWVSVLEALGVFGYQGPAGDVHLRGEHDEGS
jgi:hypothetical protein